MQSDSHGIPKRADLPIAMSSLVGRERELGELTVDLAGTRRLVTLTGVGGGGKTRLALEVARASAGRLATASSGRAGGPARRDAGPRAVLAALGMREPQAGQDAPELLGAVARAPRSRASCSTTASTSIDDVAALVGALLARAPALVVLATSREALCIPGEVERAVTPLERPKPDADVSTDRLADYARSAYSSSAARTSDRTSRIADDNAAAIAKISAALDGIPLAIELVAARLRTLVGDRLPRSSTQQMRAARVGRARPPGSPADDARDARLEPRSAPRRRADVFRRLSIFAGGFTLDAAERDRGRDGRPRRRDRGAGRQVARRGRSSSAEPRLRMLEPVRQYAAEKLRDAGEYDRIAARHLELGGSVRGASGPWLRRGSSASGARGCATSRTTSARRSRSRSTESAMAPALRIAASLGYPWFTMGQPDARLWMARALDSGGEVPARVRARALYGAGMLAESALDYDEALQHLGEALAIARRAGSRRLEGWILMALGHAARSVDVDGRPERGLVRGRASDLPRDR